MEKNTKLRKTSTGSNSQPDCSKVADDIENQFMKASEEIVNKLKRYKSMNEVESHYEEMESQLNDDTEVNNRNKRMKISEENDECFSINTNSDVNCKTPSQKSSQELDELKENFEKDQNTDPCDLNNDSKHLKEFKGFPPLSDHRDEEREHNANSILTGNNDTTQSTDSVEDRDIVGDAKKRKIEVETRSVEKPTNESNSKPKSYFCKSCELVITGKDEYDKHLQQKHPTKRIKITTFEENSNNENVIGGKKKSSESDSSFLSYEAKKLMNNKLIDSVKRIISERRRNIELKEKQEDERLREEQNDKLPEEFCEEIEKNNENGNKQESIESIEPDQKKDENNDEMTLDELHKVLDAQEDDLDNIMYEQKVDDISALYKNISGSNKKEMKKEEEEEDVSMNENKEEDVSINKDKEYVRIDKDKEDVCIDKDKEDVSIDKDEEVHVNKDKQEDVYMNKDQENDDSVLANEYVSKIEYKEKNDVLKSEYKRKDEDVLKNENKGKNVFSKSKEEEENYIHVDIPFELEISAALQMNKDLNLDDMTREDFNDTINVPLDSIDIENIIIAEDKKPTPKPTLSIIKKEPFKVKKYIKFESILKKNDDNLIRREMLEQEIITKELLNAKIKYGPYIRTTIKNRKIVLMEQKIVKRELLKILANNMDIYKSISKIPMQSYASDLLIQDIDLRNLRIYNTKRNYPDSQEMINEEILSKELLKLGIVNSACLQYNQNLDEEMKLVKSIILENENKSKNNNRCRNILKVPSKSFVERERIKKMLKTNNFEIDLSNWENIKNNLISGIYPKSKYKLLNEKEENQQKKDEIDINELVKKFVKSSGVHRINNCSLETNDKLMNNIEIWYKGEKVQIKSNKQVTARIDNYHKTSNMGYRSLNMTKNIIKDELKSSKQMVISPNILRSRLEEGKQGLRILENDKNNKSRLQFNLVPSEEHRRKEEEIKTRRREDEEERRNLLNVKKCEEIELKKELKSILNGSLNILEDFKKYNELENQECDSDMARKRAATNNYGENKRQRIMEPERSEVVKEFEALNGIQAVKTDELSTKQEIIEIEEINESFVEIKDTEEIKTEPHVKGVETEEPTMRFMEELGINNNNNQNNESDDLAPFLELDFNMLPNGLRIMNENGGDILLDMAHRMIDRLR